MRRRAGESGHALVLALVVLLTVTLSSALLAQVVVARLAAQQREIVRVHLDLMVDGVVAETLAGLARDRRFAGLDATAWQGGEVWSRVEARSGGEVTIEAAARLGSRGRSALVVARVAAGAPRIVGWKRSTGIPSGSRR
jgi:hypothetical protein